ncbi:glycosyltransferase [Flagellimonas sp. S3867]|uniref:glycosyltransferase n=1 Tax=Flagellimonas sp. S3867 TaxID=2768063 RepID=UPI001683233B|nr:glycosyltransferase [Flagellimonas sp. S3867]
MTEIKPKLSIINLGMGSAGAEKVISLLLKKLKDDYDVTLFLLFKERHYDIPPEIKVIGLTKGSSESSIFIKLLQSFLILWKYNSLLRKRKIEYAISFLPYPNFINGISSLFNPSIRFFVSERGYPSNNTSKKISLYIAKVFYPLLYNRCYKLFSNSVYINKDLKENFGIRIPTEVIYNPIELPEKTKKSETLASNIDMMKVITVGSLIDRKNQGSIIKALGISNYTYVASIIGEGPLQKNIEMQVSDLELNRNVRLLGGGIQNVNDFLVENDCFVLSSKTEGFPNALLEAMAAGLPCISTNCLSGPQELINENLEVKIDKGSFFMGKYGILVEVNDSLGLSKALDYLTENPSERERLSRLSLKRAKDYELNGIYKVFNEFIKS